MVAGTVNATLRQKASNNLEQVNQQIRDLAERSRGYQLEKLQLHSERVGFQSKRDELLKVISAAKAERERALLECDIAMNTSMEEETTARLAAIDQCIAEAAQDIHVIDTEYQISDGLLVWKTRESFLDQFIADTHRERDELLAKRAGLEAIHARVHQAHGQDEHAAIISEFEALAGQEQAVQEQLRQVADLRAQLQSTISDRLRDWPAIALEVELAHGSYRPDPQTAILTHWLELLAEIEQHAAALEPAMVRELTFARVPIGIIQAYGPRAAQRHDVRNFDKADPAFYNFDGYIRGLESIRDAMVSEGRRRQADQRVFAPAKEG